MRSVAGAVLRQAVTNALRSVLSSAASKVLSCPLLAPTAVDRPEERGFDPADYLLLVSGQLDHRVSIFGKGSKNGIADAEVGLVEMRLFARIGQSQGDSSVIFCCHGFRFYHGEFAILGFQASDTSFKRTVLAQQPSGARRSISNAAGKCGLRPPFSPAPCS